MVQVSLIFLLGAVVIIFAMILKVYFMLRETGYRMDDFEVRLIKLEKEVRDNGSRQNYLESNLRMLVDRLKKLQ